MLAETLDWTWPTKTVVEEGWRSHHISLMICKYGSLFATDTHSMLGGLVTSSQTDRTLLEYIANFCLGEPTTAMLSSQCFLPTDSW